MQKSAPDLYNKHYFKEINPEKFNDRKHTLIHYIICKHNVIFYTFWYIVGLG